MKRREFLEIAASSAGAMLLGACASSPPLVLDARLNATLDRLNYRGLALSLSEEQDYEARVEGKLPAELRGTYFRNGPGLFERDGVRKRTILDGDGMVQQFRFHDRGVHYRTRFVQTEKYRAESVAGKFIYPSWSTQAPGGFLKNFWITEGIKSQAGITVYLVNGRLYTFDESSFPYEMDPVTLATIGETSLGIPREETIYSAHSKIDPRNGEWLHFGVRYGPSPQLHLSVFHASGRLNYHRVEALPRFVYLHDWFVSTNFLIISLHPVYIDFWPALMGLRSISDSLRWRPEKGNLLLVIPRDPVGRVVQMEAPACFMWHSINARDNGSEIVADFIGYDNPDHFVGTDPVISAVMQGREGEHAYPGLLRRYRIDLGAKRCRAKSCPPAIASGRVSMTAFCAVHTVMPGLPVRKRGSSLRQRLYAMTWEPGERLVMISAPMSTVPSRTSFTGPAPGMRRGGLPRNALTARPENRFWQCWMPCILRMVPKRSFIWNIMSRIAITDSGRPVTEPELKPSGDNALC